MKHISKFDLFSGMPPECRERLAREIELTDPAAAHELRNASKDAKKISPVNRPEKKTEAA